jgi:hypothetical protein
MVKRRRANLRAMPGCLQPPPNVPLPTARLQCVQTSTAAPHCQRVPNIRQRAVRRRNGHQNGCIQAPVTKVCNFAPGRTHTAVLPDGVRATQWHVPGSPPVSDKDRTETMAVLKAGTAWPSAAWHTTATSWLLSQSSPPLVCVCVRACACTVFVQLRRKVSSGTRTSLLCVHFTHFAHTQAQRR